MALQQAIFIDSSQNIALQQAIIIDSQQGCYNGSYALTHVYDELYSTRGLNVSFQPVVTAYLYIRHAKRAILLARFLLPDGKSSDCHLDGHIYLQ